MLFPLRPEIVRLTPFPLVGVHRAKGAVALLIAVTLGACGNSDPPYAGKAAATGIDTLAYVLSTCTEDSTGLFGNQALIIRQRDGTEKTIEQLDTLSVLRISGICPVFGIGRFGFGSVAAGAFQRLGVSPDGGQVVFEVTTAFSLLHIDLPPETTGIFSVSADGSGLRRLGPPSRTPSFSFLSGDIASVRNNDPFFAFSPDGRSVVFTDLGPGPDGTDAIQIFRLDLDTGERRQLTGLPQAASPPAFEGAPGTCCPRFLNDDTIAFATTADADGLNPGGGVANLIVSRSGGGPLRRLDVPTAAGLEVLPVPGLSGLPELGAAVFVLPSTPVNAFPPRAPAFPGFPEVFTARGGEFLRLTDYHRVDTLDPLPSADGKEVFFVASADPAGSNPTHNCQVFSAPIGGGIARQITAFAEGDSQSRNGCIFDAPPGCSVLYLSQDTATDALVFYSSCDPFGTNPNGGQIFSMRPDGGELRQVTAARGGYGTEDDGTVRVELPGPFAYPEQAGGRL